MPDAVIIGQDEETQIHVQPLMQSGRRHVDIRVWRKGPSGFAPSRSGLTLGAADLDALQEGIADLLRASNNGTEVARIVWDGNEGRRLRAEIAPFGTRHVARLGFWQRVRSSWRPADDGLVLSADRLIPLQGTLQRVRGWLLSPVVEEERQQLADRTREMLGHWPSPGADWLTVEVDRVAFHPRGVRVTAMLAEAEGEHRVCFRQWRRQESLWLPEDRAIELAATALESVLVALEALEEIRAAGETGSKDIGSGEETVRVSLDGSGRLVIEHGRGGELEEVIAFPAEYLLRFGRFLLQSWSLLLERLTEEEWSALEAEPFVLAEHLHEVEHEPNRSELLAEAKATVTPEAAEPPPAQPAEQELAETTDGVAAAEEELAPPVSLGAASVGEHWVVFSMLPDDVSPTFLLSWEGCQLVVPIDLTEELVSGLRSLYYDALLGRRHTLGLAEAGIRAGMHNEGMRLCLLLEAEHEGKRVTLSIPAVEVPGFLNAVEAALAPIASVARDDLSPSR